MQSGRVDESQALSADAGRGTLCDVCLRLAVDALVVAVLSLYPPGDVSRGEKGRGAGRQKRGRHQILCALQRFRPALMPRACGGTGVVGPPSDTSIVTIARVLFATFWYCCRRLHGGRRGRRGEEEINTASGGEESTGDCPGPRKETHRWTGCHTGGHRREPVVGHRPAMRDRGAHCCGTGQPAPHCRVRIRALVGPVRTLAGHTHPPAPRSAPHRSRTAMAHSCASAAVARGPASC